MSTEATYTVRRHFVSGNITTKDFEDIEEAKEDFYHAQSQDRVSRCEIVDNRLGQVMREWVLSDPDPE